MKILAIEYASAQRSVAVLDSQKGSQFEIIEAGGRAAKTFQSITAALRNAELEPKQIECVAIGLGPGSYTGIRAAIALAQGWQLATNINLLGISSMEALAREAQHEGLRDTVHLVIDAQRNELYHAAYEISDARCAVVHSLKLMSLQEVQTAIDEGGVVAGPEVSRWFQHGKILHPRALRIAELALENQNFVPGQDLVPIYLRQTTFVKAPPARLLPS